MPSLIRIVLCAALLGMAGHTLAQTWPARPVRIIVPVGPGSGPDIILRLIGERLAGALGRQVLIDNVTGAGTVVASQTAAHAAPDGYTLYVAGVGALITDRYMFKSLPYDGERDFAPIAMLYESAALVLVVHPDVQAKSVAELIALAKAHPGKLSYGNAGGGVIGMIGEWFNKVAGTNIVPVNYKSPPQMLQDVVAGRTQMVFISISPAEPFRKSGQLRALGVSSAKRFPAFADVPTISETLPEFRIEGFGVLTAPTGTPAEVIQRLNREVDAIVKQPDYLQRLISLGISTGAGAGTPQSIADFLRGERALWSKVLTGLNIQPE
jgi:tripartite-type tricarboxylate transporter receptor subunit TctC